MLMEHGRSTGARDRIFVNNVDGYVAGAVCADLYKSNAKIVGTRKSRGDTLIPPFVRIVPRMELRKLLKQVASSDVVVYDLHDADLEELELVVRTLHTSEITHTLTFILISSVGVWARTHREYECTGATEEEDPGGDGGVEGEQTEGQVPAAVADGEAAEGADAAVETTAAPTGQRPMPLRSEDYTRRLPAPKFLEWKSIETQVLALKEKGTVRPHVVCAGIPYGNGEEPFLGLFKAAWQGRDTLRVIGDGSNCIPLVHVRDVARVVRHILEGALTLPYHLAVDRGQNTQREIVQAVASEYGLGSDVKSVSIAEAVLAELADILTLDLRMIPCDLMEVPYVEVVEQDIDDGAATGTNAVGVNGSGEGYPPNEGASETAAIEEGNREVVSSDVTLPFRWWCEQGLPANIGKVSAEFSRWRRLQPVKILLIGPPGCGAEVIGERLAVRYNIPHLGLDSQIEKLKNREGSSLGQQLREACDAIAANVGNPKSQGPFVLPSPLLTQTFEELTAEKVATFRGFVSSGFPSTAEEAEFFLMDAPPPTPPAEDPEAEEAPPPPAEPQKIPVAARVPDMVIIVTNSDEECSQRGQEELGLSEKEFKSRMEKWKKENPEEGPGMPDLIREKFQMEPVLIDMEQTSPEAAENQIVVELETKRHIYNFMLPPQVGDDAGAMADAADNDNKKAAREAEETNLRREAEEKRKKKDADEKIEQIKKDELVRLEKHSEPLRQYLMSLVVPTLTSGLIEVCREVPDDPVGYLSEYLSVNAQLAKQRAKNKNKLRSEQE
jgi:adenylate kinase